MFNIEKRLKFQFPLDYSSIFKYWIDFLLQLLENTYIFISQGYKWGYDV